MSHLLATLSVLALFSIDHERKTDVAAFESGRWRLEVRYDAFRREVLCKISDDYGRFSKVVAEPQALLLTLPGHADGSTAWFSLDGAPAKPWRDVEGSLIAAGAMVNAESLDNAVGGHLPLPYASVAQAQLVTIQIKKGARLQEYSLRGLWEMIGFSNRLGFDFPSNEVGK